jgi:hypothetical protein
MEGETLKSEAKERQRKHGGTSPGRKKNTRAESGTSERARDVAAKLAA